ncbi:MAG: sigma-70 family RNA polymerase sigma factor, partial [Gemmataceae bacterium]|nr:sigma-70 family RNA polymerase sigma factor [Gemmataceae bacterium]
MTEPVLPRVAVGDPAAVRECIARYGPLVWGLARRLVPNPADAEDAAQDVFISLWQSAGRYDPAQAAEVTFVAMIARRRLIDRRRRARRHPPPDPLPEAVP